MSAVNSPSHYNVGSTEVIDAIEAWELNFSRGSVVKYVARAGHKSKDHEIEDLQKALWYIAREIKRVREENTSGQLPLLEDF